MPETALSEAQIAVAQAPLSGSICLSGQAGSGKTTAGVARLRYLVEHGVPGESILVLAPQRSLANPYYTAVRSPSFPPGGQPSVLTFIGLAQRMISLFWPMISSSAGFKYPRNPPSFLTLETAQYFLARIVEPLLDQGYFESLTIDPNRLYSQILDNLNKSATVGFDPTEIAPKLSDAWTGRSSQLIIYEQAQECAIKFRNLCLQNNMLDFSVQLDVFTRFLWPSLLCNQYLRNKYHHLIFENIEEDYPVAHDLVKQWLPYLDSALLIKDSDAGFRSFLGADAISANRLAETCTGKVVFSESYVKSFALQNFEIRLTESLLHKKTQTSQVDDSYSIHPFRFYPESLDWVTNEIHRLIHADNINPGDIAILTPFLSDSLRFAISSRLSAANLPFTTYRPSRSLRDEPEVKTVLTLAKLAHPSWGIQPAAQDVRNALTQSILGCDYIRADLLSQTVYKSGMNGPTLHPFDVLKTAMQARITFAVGESYERIRQWLEQNFESGSVDLDHWISRLFGEVLSQPGFGFHSHIESAIKISHLVDSCRMFRKIFSSSKEQISKKSGLEFVQVLEKGLLAAQSLEVLSAQSSSNAVFLSPAFSFLMRNRPVRIQFWMDIGSHGWWSRLDQPLTQPYVLSRNWNSGRKWTDDDDYQINQANLAKITTGLIRRCSGHIYLCNITYNEQGMEDRGQLVLAMQNILREKIAADRGSDV